MWPYRPVDERRYDTLLGLSPKARPVRDHHPRQRRHLLRVAARLCRWRDGQDGRLHGLSRVDRDRRQAALIRDLADVMQPKI